MTFQGERRYSFLSNAMAEDTFAVVRFTGREAISQPYRFDITLATEDPEIDLRAMLQNPARFVIHRRDLADRVFHGVLAEFEQVEESGDYVIYKAALVPRLWHAGLYHENQLFLEKSVQDIITEVLQQTRLTSQDFTIRFTGSYDQWEYICQWRETDLNFLQRWMEREGIYYYFSQDDEKEKTIIADSATAHENISAEHRIVYSPPSATVPRDQEVIHSFVCRQQRLPNKVILRDYNYRRPSLELRAEAVVDPNAHGEIYLYGEHFKTPEEGNHLAQIRAEELLCRERTYHGESTAANLCSGFLFELQEHYRESHNGQYLVVEVQHRGCQAIASLAGRQSRTAAAESELEYSNRFVAVAADAQFRPERVSSKPRFYGTLNATVDASGDGQYAEIDDQGRYKVVLPFDRSGNDSGRASRWIRMAQPYAGNDFGMHFPLHRGTEVLITFVDGDPDRPIIAGSVPNPDNASPVTTGNQTQAMIRTGGGNQIKFEDHAGSQLIRMDSPTSKSYFRIGATNSNPPGIDMGTDNQMTTTVGGHVVTKIGQDYTCTIEGKQHKITTGEVQYEFHSNSKKVVRGNAKEEVYGNKDTQTVGNTTEKYDGNKQSTVSGNTDETFVGHKKSASLATTSELYAGAKYASCLAAVNENFVGIKTGVCAAMKLEECRGPDLNKALVKKIHGDQNIEFKCGASQISMTPSSIEIKCGGSKMTLNAGGDIIVRGSRFDVTPSSNMQVHCGGTKFKITGSTFFVHASKVDMPDNVNQG